MATVTRSNVSLATKLPPNTSKYQSIVVGEDIAAGDACYIKTDGKVYKSTAAAANAAAEVHGFAVESALVGQRQKVTLHHNVTLNYGSGLTPGQYLYLSATVAGALDTASSANAGKPVGLVLDDGKKVRVRTTF